MNDIRTIIVVGDNHSEIVKKYSGNTKVEPYIRMKFKDAENKRDEHIKLIENILTDERILINEEQRSAYKDMYLVYSSMTPSQYFDIINDGYIIDEKTKDAYSDFNINSFYKHEKCYQEYFLKTGNEAIFSSPFILKDGNKSYSAHYEDIDWDFMHKNEKQVVINSVVWELVIEGREPSDENERYLRDAMASRKNYFKDNFYDKEEFVISNTYLWYWGIATKDEYFGINFRVDEFEWKKNFFEKYILPLKNENPLITIYECKIIF